MDQPLQLSFKTVALSPQISVTDATGRLLLYVKQKAFKLKEAVTVFADREQTTPLYAIAADRVLDFSAQYTITNRQGRVLGAVRREGMRSLWRARYEVVEQGRSVLSIREANPWVKVADGLLGEVPGLGLLTGYFFHPAYELARADGVVAMQMQKQAAFFEGRYSIRMPVALSEAEHELALLSLLMVVLLERRRG